MSSIPQDKRAEQLQGGLELLLAAVHADDPKREILVRIGDLIREAAVVTALQRTAPDGWQIVPKEPTPEMVAACMTFARPLGPRGTYRAMLAAAPILAEKRSVK